MANQGAYRNIFSMPAEWELHNATWLTWPHDIITFPNRIEQVEQTFAAIIFHLHQNELVQLLVLDDAMHKRASAILKSHKVNIDKLIFHKIDYADVWIRDYGPTFLIGKNGLAWVKWRYNAYGNKFPDLLKDDKVFFELKSNIKHPMIEADVFMEGGAIEVNGQGTLLTTEECLLNSNRNPLLTKTQTEEYLQKYLGIQKIIWLKKGILNDHTDGHIDEIARFVSPDTIVCAYENERSDPNFALLDENWHILQKATDQNGKKFNLVKLPMPKMNYDYGERAPVSYANFYIANQIVLVPQFNHENDKLALSIIANLFPNHEAIGIDCTNLIYGGGTIHCITQQEPHTK